MDLNCILLTAGFISSMSDEIVVIDAIDLWMYSTTDLCPASYIICSILVVGVISLCANTVCICSAYSLDTLGISNFVITKSLLWM